MAELTANPEGCKKFEANAFKKDKCKHCQRSWTEHKGVISDVIVQGFQKAQLKASEDKQRAEQEAHSKARAKQLAKKKQNQAVEDSWFMDGKEDDLHAGPSHGDTDSDDDMGFQMFIPNAPVEADKPAEKRAFKVVNLIDFGECDVAEESPPLPGGVMSGAGSAQLDARQPAAPIGQPVGPAGVKNLLDLSGATPSASSSAGPFGGGGAQQLAVVQPVLSSSSQLSTSSRPQAPAAYPMVNPEDLQSEIEDLRQMLADANEEKSIQVAIVQDEVADKQERLTEAEATIRELRGQVAELQAQVGSGGGSAPSATEAELKERVEQERAEADRLRNDNARLEAEIDRFRRDTAEAAKALEASTAGQAEAAQAEAELAAAKAEVEQAWAAERKARAAEAEATARAAEQQAELASARAEADQRTRDPQTQLEFQKQAHCEADLRPREACEADQRTREACEAALLPGQVTAEQMGHMGRYAAQGVREIRLNAEHQLAWLSKRMLEVGLPAQPVR